MFQVYEWIFEVYKNNFVITSYRRIKSEKHILCLEIQETLSNWDLHTFMILFAIVLFIFITTIRQSQTILFNKNQRRHFCAINVHDIIIVTNISTVLPLTA